MDVAVIADTLKEEMEMNLKNGLYHLTQIQFAYNSNHIEGSRLTNDQTRYIYETNTIDTIDNGATNVDDIIETVNHFACFRYILAHIHEELTEHFVKEIHKILKSSTSDASKDWFKVGDYKTRANMVGNKNTA
ncbi:MAG: cell filamentation protein Fic, partial [Lachnospiraceae bacterium]|nr:cell filamentation protein Fic [Lachnospiraceae bacterium]